MPVTDSRRPAGVILLGSTIDLSIVSVNQLGGQVAGQGVAPSGVQNALKYMIWAEVWQIMQCNAKESSSVLCLMWH